MKKMRRNRRKKMDLKWMIVIFVVTTFVLSTGYSLLYETLSVEGTANIILEDDDEESSTGDLKFTYQTNSWHHDGIYYYQIDGVLENLSSSETSDWKIILYLPEGAANVASWNGTLNLEGNKLTITSVDYNKTIAANSSIKIGFQLTLPSDEFYIEKIILNGKVATNGETSEDTSSSATDTTTGNTNENDNSTGDTNSGVSGDIGFEAPGASDEGSTEEPGIDTNDNQNNETDDNVDDNVSISNLTSTSSLVSEWQSGDSYLSQHKFTIKNNDDIENSDWQVKIKLPEGVTVSQAWGCNYIDEDGTLKISSVNYNKTIGAGSSIDVTILFSSPTKGFVPTIINE